MTREPFGNAEQLPALPAAVPPHAATMAGRTLPAADAAQVPAPAHRTAPRLALVRDELPVEQGSDPGVFPDHASTVALGGPTGECPR